MREPAARSASATAAGGRRCSTSGGRGAGGREWGAEGGRGAGAAAATAAGGRRCSTSVERGKGVRKWCATGWPGAASTISRKVPRSTVTGPQAPSAAGSRRGAASPRRAGRGEHDLQEAAAPHRGRAPGAVGRGFAPVDRLALTGAGRGVHAEQL